MRTFKGRSSEELYNEKLHGLFEALQHVIDKPEDNDLGPITGKDGALWLDRDNGELKFKNHGIWETVFNDKLKMISEILKESEPQSPINGQLWLEDGVLNYYSGTEWLPVKSVNVDTEFNLSAFEQFLIINPMSSAGKLVINEGNENAKKLKMLYLEEVFAVASANREYVLEKGTYSLDTNSVTVHIQGRKLPRECVMEVNENTIRVVNYQDVDGIEDLGYPLQVMIEYINKDSMSIMQKVEYGTSYSQKIEAKAGQKDFELDKFFVPDQEQLNIYLNGRKLTRDAYLEVGNKAFSLTNPLVEDSIIEAQIVYYSIRDSSGTSTNLGEFLEPSETHAQFLLPDVSMDKFFVNGLFTHTYKEISNVAIEYPISELQGKKASAVHVNPKKLTGITKRLFLVDKANPNIMMSETNTEFYGIKDGIGKLLLKSDIGGDYTTVSTGIRLSTNAQNLYDFVQSVTYEFKNYKGKGSLIKKKIILSDSTSIYIGQVSDPLCIFIQGLYLDEDAENYVYEDGYIKLKMETKMDVGVISFPGKEIGTIATMDGSEGLITVNKEYLKKMLFVYGEGMNFSIGDYTVDPINSNVLRVKDAKVGMKYAIVETKTADGVEDMILKSGLVEKDQFSGEYFIDIKDEIASLKLKEEDEIMLFVNGLLIAKKDTLLELENNRIIVNGGYASGLKEGLDYIILKSPNGRFLFSDKISFNTIPLGHKSDSSLVYISNQLATDAAAVQVSKLPIKGLEGEIRQLLTNTTSDWYVRSESQWKMITDTEAIRTLNATAASYISDGYSIGILQNFGPKECVYYSYKYDSVIEQPLLRGDINTYKEKSEYKTAFNHYVPSGRNALSIWQNGLRQNHDTTGNPENFDGYFELAGSRFKMPVNEVGEYVDGGMFYIIEPLENSEIKSCERQIIKRSDIIEGSRNIFKTDIPLWPGNVRVFISGMRQPKSAYTIIDNYSIMINEEILAYDYNFPVEDVIIDGTGKTISREREDSILIEVRQDALLKELEIPIRYTGQNEFTTLPFSKADITAGGDGLPDSLVSSKDFIMIYINGLAYGKNYKITDKTLYLLNEDITKCLGADPIEEYFRSNPDKYAEWRLENGGIEYERKKITDTIIFEWR